MADEAHQGNVTSLDEAAALLTARVRGAPRAQPQEKPEPAPAPAVEGDDDDGADLVSTEDSAEEAEDADEVELPDTLEELAEALGISVAKLQDLKLARKVDGKTELVTLAEAVEQHQLHADYQRKTRALSEERKAFEAKRTEAQQVLESKIKDLDNALGAAVHILQTEGLSDEALERLEQEKGFEAAYKARIQRDKKLAQIQGIFQQKQAAERQQAEQFEQHKHQYRAEQQEALYSAKPALRDPAKMVQFEADLIGYMENAGYARDDVLKWMAGAWDHRQVLLAEKAMRYDRMVSEGKKKGVVGDKVGRVLKPGSAAVADKKVRSFDALKTQFRRARETGSRNDQLGAAAALLNAQMRSKKRG